MAVFCPAEPTWLEAASFEQQSSFLCCGMPTDFVANCTCICGIESIHLRCSDSNPLEGAFSEPARLSHLSDLLFSLASRLSLTPTTFLGTR